MPQSPPVPPDINCTAAEWFRENAWFRVPPHIPPSNSGSPSEVVAIKLDSLNVPIPKFAFPDPRKCQRYIDALGGALEMDPLLPGKTKSRRQPTYSDIETVYKGLFSPEIEKYHGRLKLEWRKIVNEVDSNRLTNNAMMNAVADVTYRMFDREILSDTELVRPPVTANNDGEGSQPRRNPPRRGSQNPPRRAAIASQTTPRWRRIQGVSSSTSTQSTKDKVDIVISEGQKVLYLVESKNPAVLDTLDALLSDGNLLEIDLTINTTNGLKVFNKAIYYMLYWDIPRIVVTSFRASYIFELHKVGKSTFVSYSQKISSEEKSTVMFRALLGLTLVALEIADYDRFDIKGAIAKYLTNKDGPSKGPGKGPGPGPSGLGPNKKGGSNAGKKPDGGSKKPPSGSDGQGGSGRPLGHGGRGKKRPYNAIDADESNTFGIAVEKAPEGAMPLIEGIVGSPQLEQHGGMMFLPEAIGGSQHEGIVVKKNVCSRYLRFIDNDGLSPGSGLTSLIFERAEQTPFLPLPTLSQIPCLKVLETISFDDGKAPVYKAELQFPGSRNPSLYAVKVITTSIAPSDHFRNVFKELVCEYSTYYVLALGRRDASFCDIIGRITPSCFGLFRARDESNMLQNIFVLVLEYAGKVDLKFWKHWSTPEKHSIMESMICLHSLGIVHGDAEERNLAVQYDHDLENYTYKFIDYDHSDWKLCPGIDRCTELKDAWWQIFDPDDPPDPTAFQQTTMRQYNLRFCNLKTKFKQQAEQVKEEYVVKRLLKLSELYEASHQHLL